MALKKFDISEVNKAGADERNDELRQNEIAAQNNLAGQISLFDLVSEEQKAEFEIRMPDVGEYSKEMLLGFEKDGRWAFYISGHPLEEYEEMWKKNTTNTTKDFLLDEETGTTAVWDGQSATIGGIIADKKIKYTKNDKIMAFLQVEDLLGSVEVIVFPKDYERHSAQLIEDNKVSSVDGYPWKKKRTEN